MYVRAIYIPLCKKISSTPGPPPYDPPFWLRRHPPPPVLSLSRVLAEFPVAGAPLEPPGRRYPRVCNANSHQADVLANCLCFYHPREYFPRARSTGTRGPSVKRNDSVDSKGDAQPPPDDDSNPSLERTRVLPRPRFMVPLVAKLRLAGAKKIPLEICFFRTAAGRVVN